MTSTTGQEQQGTLELQQSKKNAGPVECLGLTFDNDEARREHFLALLKEKLQDPEFRKIPGFPKGSDEDILRMSNPPYHTACPNPFIGDAIQILGQSTASASKDKRPYVADIREGRGHPIYQGHAYHTKVPHQAIMRFIMHYTEPGDFVFDGFAGTGMTGVAAQACSNPDPEFARAVELEFESQGLEKPKWGHRNSILYDLSPIATFIAREYNTPKSQEAFERETEEILRAVEAKYAWMFKTTHTDKREGTINYVIWSDLFTCKECGGEICFWDACIDLANGSVRSRFNCPHCRASLTKRDLEKVYETVLENARPRKRSKTVPVLIDYSVDGLTGRFSKQPDDDDFALLKRIEPVEISDWFPTNRLPEGDESRRNDDSGITHVHHFYTHRILACLAAYRGKGLANWLPFSALTPRATRMHRIAASRLGGPKKGEGGATVGVISGTLYVPSLQVEMNVLLQARDRCRAVSKTFFPRNGALIGTGSCAKTLIPSESIDYIFTDPPFGANIMYSELNFLWEAWLKVFTSNPQEAIINKTQGKDIGEYQALMHACFSEYYRVLKPGKWITVEFSNTSAAVWNAIQNMLEMSGFVVANVSTLDKGQGSFKAVTTPTAVKQDLIITAYKPTSAPQNRSSIEELGPDSAWSFVKEHLRKVSVFVGLKGQSQVIGERTPRLLLDRMIAFHVQRGASVPLSSPEFLQGLAQRFPERDGMYFLPDQVTEYDRKRTTTTELRQLSFFVNDEHSAIQWIRQQLQDKPQSFQDLQPQFMRELQAWAKHEQTVELKVILDQNFLHYDGRGPVPSQIHSYLSSNFKDLRNLEKEDSKLIEKAQDRWYVPDPNKQADLDQIRERALLKEFEELKESTQRRIKQFRTEAVRAGFKACWQERDYATIVKVAAKLPEAVLQEDEKLLMYIDNAQTRLGDDA